jgi:hypothetical protein
MSFQKKCRFIYTLVFVLLLLGSFIAFNPASTFPKLNGLTSTNLQQLLILAGLGGLPGVLVWSSKQVKLLKKNPDDSKRLETYKRIVWIRLAVFTLLGLFSLLLQLFTSMSGGFMFMMVILVLFVFIWPTKNRMNAEMMYLDKTVSPEQNSTFPDRSDITDEPFSSEETDDWLPH